MIKKWNEFIKEDIVNPDSYIDTRMQEISNLVSNISSNYILTWNNINDTNLTVNFTFDNLNIIYKFNVSEMTITKIVSNTVDFNINVSSIDEGINKINSDINSIIGISESILENISSLIQGNMYKITFPCYNDKNLKNEIRIVEMLREMKDGYLFLDLNNKQKFKYSFNMLKDCIIENYE